jgi:SpoVK/Ycf46/Vps4 family AAA+-type ATPase
MTDHLPKGISKLTKLPEKSLDALWDSIVLDQASKNRLLAQAALNFTVRGKVPRTTLPLHGVILLYGSPGTGKTSLARGLASRVANSFKAKFQLLEVEPHSLTSAAMGKTQKAVSELFSQSIAECAATTPTVVLLDEVETLAVDRSRLSMDANPIDIHRATDAVLVQLDQLADSHPHLLFVATSNFPTAIDSAFTSRCDLVMEIPLPNAQACQEILSMCLNDLAGVYPRIKKLGEPATVKQLAASFVGLDGRAIRKAVASALGTTLETAVNPETVTADQLVEAAKLAKAASTFGGRKK